MHSELPGEDVSPSFLLCPRLVVTIYGRYLSHARLTGRIVHVCTHRADPLIVRHFGMTSTAGALARLAHETKVTDRSHGPHIDTHPHLRRQRVNVTPPCTRRVARMLRIQGDLTFKQDATFVGNWARTVESGQVTSAGAISNTATGKISFEGDLTVLDNEAEVSGESSRAVPHPTPPRSSFIPGYQRKCELPLLVHGSLQ